MSTLASVPPSAQTHNTAPDFRWIKKYVSILELARQLGIRGLPSFHRPHATCLPVRCFRPWHHKNGDRTPSLNLNLKRNRFQCFVCDSRAGSNIDLVMFHEGMKSPHQAALWIAERFDVPVISPPSDWVFRAGVDEISGLDDAIRAGLLRFLTPSQRSILFSLWAFRNASEIARVSYASVMECAHVGSRTTVTRAIRRFEELGLLDVQGGWDPLTKQRAKNQYIFTWRSPKLLDSLRGLSPLPGALEGGGLSPL